ncbi:PREDICTED: meteorin-like protein [Condylura cristata]|uniref:meteorin-like protein n=1 Tax=Condylura cristata TaxID=143302 RepID=UPI00033432CE|nr:PREDICTED: meteorin-like protein [Condylura cristata]
MLALLSPCWTSPGTSGSSAAPHVGLPDLGGLTHEAHRKEVEQVYLRCAAGAVEWMYPTGALIVNLRPNTASSPRPLTLCIQPLQDASGANIYLEKTGELKLLVRDGERGPGQTRCFPFARGGLFVEATPQLDISRRATGFQYELTGHSAGSHLQAPSGPPGGFPVALPRPGLGRPRPACSDPVGVPSPFLLLQLLQLGNGRRSRGCRLAGGHGAWTAQLGLRS